MLTDGNMLIKDYGYNRKGAHHANLILFKIIGVEVGLLLREILLFFLNFLIFKIFTFFNIIKPMNFFKYSP